MFLLDVFFLTYSSFQPACPDQRAEDDIAWWVGGQLAIVFPETK
jgi:hypothetical protein